MNIPEILVANGTGIILVVFLFLLRVRNSETKQTGAVLYDGMLAVTLVALVTETISFLIDGQPFRGCHTLVVLTNTSAPVPPFWWAFCGACSWISVSTAAPGGCTGKS